MHFNNPKFKSTDAQTIAIILHGYRFVRKDLADVFHVVHDAYDAKGGVDIYAPTLPYNHWWDWSGCNNIVIKLVEDLDEIWRQHKYNQVIFIGHSLGGILLRRVFLAGSQNSPDYSDDYLFRDDLPKHITGEQHEWASQVKRIILLASWDKGWSLSAGEAWKYSFGLNFLGFLGRIAELTGLKAKPGRTMLDMRLGSPFIVQTRLLWMAYRRWHSEPLRNMYNKANPLIHLESPPEETGEPPLVIQIIGTGDDFVSPQNQVDYDVDAAEITAQKYTDTSDQPIKNYFLIEMPHTDHASIVNLKDLKNSTRKFAFLSALTGDRSVLSHYSHNPAHFDDTPTKPDPSVKDVVFVMHGIRDDGYWTHRIAKAIKEVAAAQNKPEHIESWTQTYGYFPMGAFLLPWVRKQKVEWFMDKYVSIKAHYPNATMHYVGHSNGTYLAATALKDYAAARFGRVYFAGSVVNPTFDWSSMVDNGRVEKFHNARGATDWVVALLPKSIEYFTDLGGAGFDGFEQTYVNSAVTESHNYAKGGHGGAIGEGHWPEIANFIVTGKKPFAIVEPIDSSGLFDKKQHYWLKFFADLRIGIPLAFSLAALLVLLGFSLWLPSEYRQWHVTDFTDGWGYVLWGCSLIAFLALQYRSKPAPTLRNIIGWLSLLLMLTSVSGVANFIFTSFFADMMAFSEDVAWRTAGAVITLTGFAALLRFILKRF
jgi:pimeloyl-ACP methyl ester carboxylesterase